MTETKPLEEIRHRLERTEAHLEKLVKDLGAHHVVGHASVDEIMAITNNRGVNVILEMRADLNLQTDLQLLAQSGRVIKYSNAW